MASEDTQNPDTTDVWALARIRVDGEGCFYKFGQTFEAATFMLGFVPGVTIKVDSGTVEIKGVLSPPRDIQPPYDIHAILFIGYGTSDPGRQTIHITGWGIMVTN